MATTGSLQLSHDLGLCRNQVYGSAQFKVIVGRRRLSVLGPAFSSPAAFWNRDAWSIRISDKLYGPIYSVPYRSNGFKCYSLLGPGRGFEFNGMKVASTALMRSYSFLQDSPLIFKLAPAVGMISFAVWGLEPLMRMGRNLVFKKNDNNWKRSNTYHITTSYVQPLLLWTSAILICRVLDPVVLPTEASQLVKQRLLNFIRSLSTVLAFAYCLSSFIQQTQKFFMESSEPGDARNMGFQFAGKAIYSAVWVAAVSLFMELLGFSTQKWLTAGGLGTVLLTLAGREIFTNFLSSAMIHATRPFVVNEWIQTKIEGYEVSGTVEHVGWWSPTIVRGEDREAVHIPNHKFTVNVVRNLSQKSHWRIKTHLAISHLDVHKINNIVADMRKVLAKNPQVEQQRLHRRVFLDNIDPENQALLILVSCFVKTSHHEEYLCVKEAILLDLLRVISHHRARLATPIRTVQKIFSDADLENVPFSDSIYNRGGVASNRSLLLIEPSYRINGDDKSKPQNRSGRVAGEQDNKGTSKSTTDIKAGTADTKAGGNQKSDTKAKETTKPGTKADSKVGQVPNSDVKAQAKSSANSSLKTNPNVAESRNPNPDMAFSTSENLNQNNGAPDSKQPKSIVSDNSRQTTEGDNPSAVSGVNKKRGLQEPSPPKHETQRKPLSPPSTSRPVLEENIVLGVALEGSKRTLPIDEDVASHPTSGEKELTAAAQKGTGSLSSEKDRKDGQLPNPPAAADDQ